jgi:hypothetical protein
VVNLQFAGSAIGRVQALHDFVHPEGLASDVLTVSGTLAAVNGEQITYEPKAGQRRTEPLLRDLPQEPAVAGPHNTAVLDYLRHFEQCLREDAEPSPGALRRARHRGTGCGAALAADGPQRCAPMGLLTPAPLFN